MEESDSTHEGEIPAMSYERAFLEAIRETPDDDAPRLIYADWLDEQGGGERSAQAAFIRAQCRLAALAEDDPAREILEDEEAELLAEYERAWTQPLHGLVEDWRFSRGFLEHVQIRADNLLTHAERLFDFASLRSLHVLIPFKDVPLLASCPHLRWIETLDFARCQLNDRALQHLLSSPHLKRLRALHLTGNNISAPGIHALIRSPLYRTLRSLDLSRNIAIGDTAARLLARTERAEHLEYLNLADTNLGLNGAFELFQSHALPSLSDLNVSRAHLPSTVPNLHLRTPFEVNLTCLNRLDASGIRQSSHLTALLSSPSLCRLRDLHLRDSQAESRTIEWLSRSLFASNLRSLDLRNNRLNAEGARLLAESVQFPSLRALSLDANNLRDEGAMAVAQMANLRSLSLAGNGIGGPGLKTLAESNRLCELRALNLASNFINAESVRALAESPHLRLLRGLNLSDSFLEEESGRILGSTANLQHLTELRLAKNLLGDAGARAIAQSPCLQRLVLLDLNDNRIGKAGAEALSTASWPRMRRLDVRGNVFTDTQENLLRGSFGEAVML